MTTTLAWALTERAAVSRRIRDAHQGCLVVGASGVGKSTVVRQALTTAGRPFVVVHGFEGLAAVPFAALNGALTERADPDDPLDADVVRRLRGWLRELVATDHAVVIDDADLLDPPSAGLLSYAAQTEGLVLVATMRTGHQLPADLERLALHRSWPTVAVDPWGLADLSAAAEATLGAPLDPALATELLELSAGVPLLVRELVLDGVDAGRIHRDRDRWTGSPSVSSPEAAARLVGRRLPSGGPALVVLQTLALTGQIRLTLLDRLAPQGVLVELDAQGLLDFPSGEQPYVRLAHPMLADALRDGLPTDQRRDLLRAVVHAARPEPGATDADRVQYLHWAFEIDERLTAGDLRDGYHAALRSLDYALAADIAGALDGLEPTAEAALFHAVALARAARVDEAVAIADTARARAERADEVVALARFLIRLHSPVGRSMGFPDGRIEVAAEVAAWADDRIGGTRFTTLLDAFTTFVAGDLGRTLEHLLLIVEDDEAPAGVADEADQFLMMVAPMAGRFDLGRAAQRRRSEQPDAELAMPALMGTSGARVSLLMYDGQLREALAQDTLAFEAAQRALAYDELMAAAAQRGMRSFILGDVDGAITWLDLSLQYRVGPHSRALLVNGVLAAALALRGDEDRLRTILEIADLERDQSPTLVLQLDYDHLAAFARARVGDTDGAEATIRSVADQAQAIGYHWLHVLARASLVRLGWADARDADCARQTLERVDAPLIQLVAELVVAAGTHDQAGLDRVADRFAAVEAGLFEVDARVAALDLVAASAPEPRGQDPDPHDRAGRQERLEQLLAACPGLRARPAADDDAPPVLSPRELEIATLAATGLASKQVAEQLGLSPRTVDNNLRRAYAKLGIEGRHQLAAALSR